MVTRLPSGCLILPMGNVSEVLKFLAETGCSRDALVKSISSPTAQARLRGGLTTVIPEDFSSSNNFSDALEVSEKFDVPLVGVIASSSGLSKSSVLISGCDIAVMESDALEHLSFSDNSHISGPFDFVGDVHNCWRSLKALAEKLGYNEDLSHPENRMLVFVGDLPDKGGSLPTDSIDTLNLVRSAWRKGYVLIVKGNHDVSLSRRLSRRSTRAPGPQGNTLKAIYDTCDETSVSTMARWLSRLPNVIILDGGSTAVVHAALRPELLKDTSSEEFRNASVYGAWPDRDYRESWAESYNGGPSRVVHGHFDGEKATCTNGVWNIDTGCYRGGGLTALRSDTDEIITVPTAQADLPLDG